MKKIGILTFHRAINNGAVLQAYALTTVFRSQGCQCNDIDYSAKKIDGSYKIKSLKQRKNLKSIILYFIQDLNILKTQDKFKAFRDNYLNISKKNYDTCISQANEDYDSFVVGSDQVWNTDLTGNDLNYYLKFVHNKPKYSYAASIGKKGFNEQNKEEIKNLLSHYKLITVREEAAVSTVNDLIEINPEVVPDPVFLLKKEEWENKFALEQKEEGFILFFMLHHNDDMIKFTSDLASKNKLKIINLTNDFKPIKGFKSVRGFGPLEFLKYISTSSYVVTDSFHAASLALILNKELYIGLKTGELKSLNVRIYGLVNKFGIKDRLISDNISYDRMKYNEINLKIDKQRNFGISVIKKIVEDK